MLQAEDEQEQGNAAAQRDERHPQEQTGAEEDLDGGNVILSAALARGFGGGPVTDAKGMVVGMVAATPRTEASGTSRTVGIPIDRIRPFLKKHLADTPLNEAAPPDGESQASAQTAIVVVMKKPAGSKR